jgi:hypothetical protein
LKTLAFQSVSWLTFFATRNERFKKAKKPVLGFLPGMISPSINFAMPG